MGIMKTLLDKGATLVAGKRYSITTQVMKRTGTTVHHVFDGTGEMIHKTVIPGVGNKSSVYSSYSANFFEGKPIQLVGRDSGLRGRTYGTTFEPGFPEQQDRLVRKGVFEAKGLEQGIGTPNSLLVSTSPKGAEVVRITGQNGELLSKQVFPSWGASRYYNTSLVNYVGGTPVQSTLSQPMCANIRAKNKVTDSLTYSNHFRRGDFAVHAPKTRYYVESNSNPFDL